jgi:rod shape-determining protein MreC
MESLLNRYRNITVLILVIFAQLVLLAVQVRNDQDVRIIRVWTVSAVTPAARLIEGLRGGGTGFLRNYIVLRDATDENKRLRDELDKLKIENHFLKSELNTAERAKALQIFQARTQSRTLAATVIGTGAGTNSKLVFIDRGSAAGVQRGMAVVTPDGIVGKVLSSYPTASEVLLVTDPDFAAGVLSQKTQSRGTLKGQGSPLCKVDYIPLEDKIEVGEWVFTSGDDRIFPRGFPVGIVKVVRNTQPFKEVLVEPAGMRRGLEDVLVLLEGAHEAIPATPPIPPQVYVAPPPPADPAATGQAAPAPGGATEADRLRQKYQAIGEAQKHVYGENPPGARAVDFNARIPGAAPSAAPPKPAAAYPAAANPAVPAPAPAPAGAAARPAPGPATVDPTAAARRRRQAGDEPPPAAQPKPPRPAPNPNDPL